MKLLPKSRKRVARGLSVWVSNHYCPTLFGIRGKYESSYKSGQYVESGSPGTGFFVRNSSSRTYKAFCKNERQKLLPTYWDMVMNIGGPIRCIYTNTELYPDDYDLDHFIPWSFVSHDLLWNLIPSDGSSNSSKSNKLPELDFYLPKLADLQHHSLQLILNADKEPKVLEDFISLGYTARELANMDDVRFRELYERTFNPINQIALNMGFETWKY